MGPFYAHAEECIQRCRSLALHTEEPDFTTRTFLCAPMNHVHADFRRWMTAAGMSVSVDAAGNLRGFYAAETPGAPVLFIGSHLDSVPRAGAFDGILGVVLGVKLVELLANRRLPYAIEVLGFSEEEGVRFGLPFIGSRAVIGDIDEVLLSRQDSEGRTVRSAILDFGLDPVDLRDAVIQQVPLGYVEFHIEQGPVLESLNEPLGVVEAIMGQTRLDVTFEGRAGHAGTTPMHLRHDALAAAAEWICAVEQVALSGQNLVATVGRVDVQPGATNVIPGVVRCSLDVRHPKDTERHEKAAHLLSLAQEIGSRRNLCICVETRLDQDSVPMDKKLTGRLARACARTPHYMLSGAGHDAMVLARRMPAAMLFLRSPQGLSHNPDESVLTGDVAAALDAGVRFLLELESLP